MDKPFILTLIRHLPTQGNREKKYIGWTDESVLPNIHTKKLNRVINQVIGSDLLRCRQTAEQLFQGTAYIPNEQLRECSFGDWEEKAYDQLKQDALYRAWLDNPRQAAPPNGESLEVMETRVMWALYKIVNEFEQPIIITHGGPIRFLLTEFASKEKSFWEWKVPHGSMYTLQWESKEHVLEGKRCTSFSVEHLMENEHM